MIGNARLRCVVIVLILLGCSATPARATAPYPAGVPHPSPTDVTPIWITTTVLGAAGTGLNIYALSHEPWNHRGLGMIGLVAGGAVAAAAMTTGAVEVDRNPDPAPWIWSSVVLGATSAILGATTRRSKPPAISWRPTVHRSRAGNLGLGMAVGF